MFVIITNLENKRKFSAEFETYSEAEKWVENHKHKGSSEKIMFSPTKIEGSKVIGERETPMGITYKLKFPAEYKVEYFDYDINDVEKHWKDFKEKQKQLLKDTDFSQLPDVNISTEERRIYRKYREYVRNKSNDYKDNNIHNWKILTYKEFKQLKYPK